MMSRRNPWCKFPAVPDILEVTVVEALEVVEAERRIRVGPLELPVCPEPLLGRSDLAEGIDRCAQWP